MPSYANPQSLNRYSYVYNAPLNYIDPSGHDADYFCSGSNDYSSSCTGYVQAQATLGSNLGGGNDGGGRGDDDDDPPGHDYGNLHDEPNPICLDLSWINCTEAEVAEYMTHFQYPGQWPWSSVEDGHNYDVYPGSFWGIPNPILWVLGMGDSGTIRVEFGDNPLTISNITEDSHIFNVGDVVRRGRQDENGNWHVTTRGAGTNDGYGIIPGTFLDAVNQNIGPIVFEAVDFQMVVYTTVVESGQYISSFFP